MECFRDKPVKVEARRGVHPHPPALLKTADEWLANLRRDGDLHPGDQAWVVLDEDDATDQQLQAVFEWAAERKDRGVGFSVPQFEYWLLLHFADAKGASTQKDVLDSLMQHWPHTQNPPSQVSPWTMSGAPSHALRRKFESRWIR
ncbi:RloB domain-containing protein [Corynebacterium wankanglinii]|nr:RloB domain-containing protein [Corynebacterium wankanglinii]